MHPAFDGEVVDGVAKADLGPIDALDGEADWSSREVTIPDLRGWLLTHAQARRVFVRGVRIRADEAAGPMDLTDLRLDAAVVLQDCRVEPALALSHATVGRLEIDGCEVRGGVQLENARLGGGLRITETRVGSEDGRSLAASNATIEGNVELARGTRLEGGVRLVGTSVGGYLAITGGATVAADPSTGWSVEADRLTVTQTLFVHGEGTRLEGALRLAGASISGQLAIADGAQIAADPSTGRSVDADLLGVSGLSVLDIGTRLKGALRLAGASISGQLAIADGAQIAADPSTGWSIDADGLRLSGGLFVDGEGTRLEGGLRLYGASVGGQLAIRGGATVAADPSTGRSIAVDGLDVSGTLFVKGKGTRLEGALRLAGASVGGQLAITSGAQIAADPSTGRSVDADLLTVTQNLFVDGEGTRLEGGLHLYGASVGGPLAIHGGATVARDVDLEAADLAILTVRSGHVGGVFDLSHARLGRLDDDRTGWAQVAGGWRLAGITIDALSGPLHDASRWTAKQRISWLQGDESPSRRPFTQVANLYREAGHRNEARDVAIAGERATSTWWRRLWAGATVGYGYQPWRAAGCAVLLIVVAFVAIMPLGEDAFAPVDREAEAGCPDAFPCLNRALYLTETVVPVIDFGQREAWRIHPRMTYTDHLQAGQYLLDVLGWVLALLLLGAVTGVVRRD